MAGGLLERTWTWISDHTGRNGKPRMTGRESLDFSLITDAVPHEGLKPKGDELVEAVRMFVRAPRPGERAVVDYHMSAYLDSFVRQALADWDDDEPGAGTGNGEAK